MATDPGSELFTYVDGSVLGWTEFRPGSRRKILAEDPNSGRLVMLVQWDAGYRMEAEHHTLDEHLYILEERLAAHRAAPDDASPWNEVLDRIEHRLRQAR